MKEKTTENKQSKYLWCLISAYIFITASSDLFESKLINILWLHAGAGILLFSLTYFLIEVITEVYGYKKARLAIWMGVLFLATFIFYSKIALLFPSPGNPIPINIIIQATARVFLSTITTIIIAEHLNAYIVSKLKLLFNGKYIGIRFICSVFCATGVSMTIFTSLAFFGKMPFEDFLIFTFSSWLYRFFTEILLVPLSVILSNTLKKLEGIDVFDTATNYNIFSLDSNYENENFLNKQNATNEEKINVS